MAISLSALQGWQRLSLAELAAKLAALSEADRAEMMRSVYELTADRRWIPTIGPQTAAFMSPADVLLYGGQAGGGKSSLICGLAMTEHKRSLIMRQQYNDLDALTEEALKINGGRRGFNGSNPPSLRTEDGRFIQFTGATKEQWQGQAFDLKSFDEAVQIAEDVIRFHLGWVRSIEAGQRTRAIMGTNPPTTSQGQYIVGMFRPWLDVTHPKPAIDGELRWYARDPDGIDVEVDGPEPILFPGQEEPTIPMSRTFIRAKLSDNPFLSQGDYKKMLDQMEEPYRSAMRDGNFFAARRDIEDQVIPLAWIRDAMKRWTPKPPPGLPMTAVGMDVSQGGADPVVLAPRYGTWFGKLIEARGKDCPDGPAQAAFVERYRRDGAPIVVDVGGGYGGDVVSVFRSNKTPHYRFNGAAEGMGKTTDGSGRGFENARAQSTWQFRDALNPDQPGGSMVALPPDPELEAELSAITSIPDKRNFQLIAKKEIRKLLGRSPNRADAVIMAWGPGEKAVKRYAASLGGGSYGRSGRANVGYSDIKRAGW